jgi:hypothetical protein
LTATLAVWVVLFLLAAIIPGVLIYRSTHDGSVDLVTTFLAALHRKDIPEALRVARPASRPNPAQQVFLSKDAMRTDWRLVSTKEAGDPAPNNGKDERLISIQIAAADGTTGHGSIYLLADPNPPKGLPGWRIPTPWSEVVLDSPLSLNYLSLNGKAFKTPLPATVYDFYPGSYAAQSLAPTLVTATDRQLVVANAGYPKATVDSMPLAAELTPATQHIYQQQMQTQLNLCARSTSRAPGNCPFQLADPTTFDDGVVIGRFSGLHWKIDSFPQLGQPVRGPDGSFRVDTYDAGQATVAGDGVGISNGNLYTITVRCRLNPSYLVAPVPPNTLTVTAIPGAPTC